MRRRPLLTFAALGAVLVVVAASVLAVYLRRDEDDRSDANGSRVGLVPLASNGSGATVVLSGALTEKAFKVEAVRVEGSRLAGKSSDPDQFRATLLDSAGRELETIRMWSPLLRLVWNAEGRHEPVTLAKRRVRIPVPVSTSLESVVLSWTGGRRVARVSVGDEVREFCAGAPANPAC